jgi:hypothetical protein
MGFGRLELINLYSIIWRRKSNSKLSGVSMRSLSSRSFHFVAALVIPICASAGDVSCDRIPELQQFDMSECECGSGLSGLPIAAPKGTSLIAACGYKNEEFIGIVGGFYFKGKATVKGKVRHVSNPAPEGAVLFDANATGMQIPFRNAILSLKFDDDSFAVQRFGAPPVSEQSPCVSADATIKVKLLYVKATYDENEDGNFPKDFEVFKVGPYEPCTEQELGQEPEPEPEPEQGQRQDIFED